MWTIYEPCIIEPRIEESQHTGDTQTNEALNQSIAKYAPKNKFLGSTMALTHRVNVAVGVHNLGNQTFYQSIYTELELNMCFVTRGYLHRKDDKNEKRRKQQRKHGVKKKRNRVKFQKLHQAMNRIRRDCEKGITYSSGIGFDLTMPPEVIQIDKDKKEELQVKCKLPGCYNKDHLRRSSKACTYYKVPQVDMLSATNCKLQELYPSSYGKFIYS